MNFSYKRQILKEASIHSYLLFPLICLLADICQLLKDVIYYWLLKIFLQIYVFILLLLPKILVAYQ